MVRRRGGRIPEGAAGLVCLEKRRGVIQMRVREDVVGVDRAEGDLVYCDSQGGPVVAVRDRWARQFCSRWRR